MPQRGGLSKLAPNPPLQRTRFAPRDRGYFRVSFRADVHPIRDSAPLNGKPVRPSAHHRWSSFIRRINVLPIMPIQSLNMPCKVKSFIIDRSRLAQSHSPFLTRHLSVPFVNMRILASRNTSQRDAHQYSDPVRVVNDLIWSLHQEANSHETAGGDFTNHEGLL